MDVRKATICDVEISRFLGVWYEIARFPHSFENGLSDVTATYAYRSPTSIKVMNQGYRNGKKKIARGNAKIMDDTCQGYLGVSFFPLIRSPYRIIALDQVHYQYALITSGYDYLWILSRSPKMKASDYHQLVSIADELGFDTKRLILVQHANQTDS